MKKWRIKNEAQKLPFKDVLFDVVICESVTALLRDKRRAVSDYVRLKSRKATLDLMSASGKDTFNRNG